MCLPNLTFEDILYFPDDNIKIFYTRPHIDCISVFDEEERVINVRDNIGDSMDAYTNTLLKYNKMNFDTCISGHNVILGKEAFDKILKEFN